MHNLDRRRVSTGIGRQDISGWS